MANNVEPEFAARTNTGMVRSYNEDSITITAQGRLAILADGMGGYNAGEVASAIATSVLKLSLEGQLQPLLGNATPLPGEQLQQLVLDSIQLANASILEEAHDEPAFSGMGTTLVLALLHDDEIMVAHVGDSRAYRLRRGELEQITRDHSVVQEQIDAGLISQELAQFSSNKNLITRALGVDYQLDIEIHEHKTEPGDLYLLCSDGLSDMLSTEEMREILQIQDTNLDAACGALIDRANANGGRDNVSAILIKVQSENAHKNGLIKRILNWNI